MNELFGTLFAIGIILAVISIIISSLKKKETKPEISQTTTEDNGDPLIVMKEFNMGFLFRKKFKGFFISEGCYDDSACYQGTCEHIKRNSIREKEAERLGYKEVSSAEMEPFASGTLYNIWQNQRGERLKQIVYCGI